MQRSCYWTRLKTVSPSTAKAPCVSQSIAHALIVTASAGIEDYINDGENALTVPVGSVADLVQAVTRLWHDASLRQSLEERGSLFATNLCTEANIAQHFLQEMAFLRIERGQ